MISAVGNTMISAPRTPLTSATRSRHSPTWVTGSPESTIVSPNSTMNAIRSSNDDPSTGDDHWAAAPATAAGAPAGATDWTCGSDRIGVGACCEPGRRRVALTTSATTAIAINRTASAISTVPRPIGDCAAAGGVAGATVCTIGAEDVASELSVALLDTVDDGDDVAAL